MEIVMGIHVGMLIFGLFDGGLAYAIVYCLLKSRFKGKKIVRILGVIMGTIIFSIYTALFIWFNSPHVSVNPDVKTVVYAAPIVLSVLLSALVLLSQPPKLKKEDGTEEPADSGIGEATAAEESL